MSLTQFISDIQIEHKRELDEIVELQRILDNLEKPKSQIISISVSSNT